MPSIFETLFYCVIAPIFIIASIKKLNQGETVVGIVYAVIGISSGAVVLSTIASFLINLF